MNQKIIDYISSSWDGLKTYATAHKSWWFSNVREAATTIDLAIEKLKKDPTEQSYKDLLDVTRKAAISSNNLKSSFSDQLPLLQSKWEDFYRKHNKVEEKSPDIAELLKTKGEVENKNRALEIKLESLVAEAQLLREQNQQIMSTLSVQGKTQTEASQAVLKGLGEQVNSLSSELTTAREKLSFSQSELAKVQTDLAEAIKLKDQEKIKNKDLTTELELLKLRLAQKAANPLENLPGVRNSRSASYSNAPREPDKCSVGSWESSRTQGTTFFAGGDEAQAERKELSNLKNLKFCMSAKRHAFVERLYTKLKESKDGQEERNIFGELLLSSVTDLIKATKKPQATTALLDKLVPTTHKLNEQMQKWIAEIKELDDEKIPKSTSGKFEPVGHIKSITSKGYCRLGEEAGQKVYMKIKQLESVPKMIQRAPVPTYN